jgi:flagellar biosynthesis chaperone FliJ
MEQAIANLESDNSELRAQLQQSEITLQKKYIELSAYLQA